MWINTVKLVTLNPKWTRNQNFGFWNSCWGCMARKFWRKLPKIVVTFLWIPSQFFLEYEKFENFEKICFSGCERSIDFNALNRNRLCKFHLIDSLWVKRSIRAGARSSYYWLISDIFKTFLYYYIMLGFLLFLMFVFVIYSLHKKLQGVSITTINFKTYQDMSNIRNSHNI